MLTLEPSSASFEMVQLNIGHLPNVEPLHLALWHRPALLAVGPSVRGGTSASLQVQEYNGPLPSLTPESLTWGVSLDFLLDAHMFPSFDYVKVDVEGSEKEIFELTSINSVEWLSKTKLITVEVHEDVRAGANESVSVALSKDGRFAKHEVGEYQVWENRETIESIKLSRGTLT